MPAAPRAASVLPFKNQDTPGSYTFGWDSKLRKADDFSSVFRFKRVLRGLHLDILFRQNGIDHPRLGLIVPKKILPRAVDRNRVRRILREAFRLSQPVLVDLDVVIRLKAAGLDADYRAQWDMFLRKSVNQASMPSHNT